jgi:AcrR family transcriptional regulator
MLDRAAALYARHGFLGASIADLAEACGVSKSLLYHYFGSKEDILFEIMADHVEQLRLAARCVLAQAPADPAARLSALTHALLRAYVGAADRHKVLVNDLDKLPEERRRSVVTAERELIDMVGAVLAELGPAYGTAPAERRASTMLFFGMINWTHTWYDPNGPVDVEALAERAVRIWLGGADQADRAGRSNVAM